MLGPSLPLFRVLGIRIGVSPSWFVVLFLFIFLLSGSFQRALGGSDTAAYAVAVAAALLFFASLVVHELGHAVVARRLGIGIVGIDLWFFGGLARLTRDADSPGTEFKVAAAGPLVTLGVIVACTLLGMALTGSEQFLQAARLQAGAEPGAALLLLSWLATINAALFVFNLVPAFPLDGGRIARALAWKLTGSRGRATRLAAGLGQGFAWLLVGLGVFLALAGNAFDGLWLVALGWFLAQSARASARETALVERLGGVSVADVMDSDPVAVPASAPAEDALEQFFLRYRWEWFPVVDEARRLVGVLRRPALDAALASGAGASAGALVEPVGPEDRVRADAPLEELLGSVALRQRGALPAVDADDVLLGVVTLEQVVRAVRGAMATRTRA